MKPKQLPLIEKCNCVTIPSVNIVHKFSKKHLSYSLIFTTNKSELFQQHSFIRVSDTGVVLEKNMFLKTSQKSKENTCPRGSF